MAIETAETDNVAARVIEERTAPGPGGNQAGKKRGPYKRKKAAPRATSTAQAGDEDKKERPPYVATESSLAAAALLSATLWKLAGPMLKLSPLKAEEAEELGRAVDPILAKYVPALDDWREELTLAVALAGAFETTRRRWQEEHPQPARAVAVPGLDYGNGVARDLGDATVIQ